MANSERASTEANSDDLKPLDLSPRHSDTDGAETEPSLRGFTFRVTARRTVLVIWPIGSLGYSTELGVKYADSEVVLERVYGALLPLDVWDWVFAQTITDEHRALAKAAAAAPTSPIDPRVMVRWATLCRIEPELVAFARGMSPASLRGVMEHVARISVPDARAYIRFLVAKGAA